ncbi:MAG: YbaK/EbsC family protein [Anaerolineae bacterium]
MTDAEGGDAISTPVTRALDELGIRYRTFRHPGPVNSLEQAARERGQRPEQVVRSIVFRVAKGEYVMVLVAGAQQVSWPILRRTLGQSRLTMAQESELLSVTGYPVGAVSPFGLPAPMRILADESVFREEEISIGSGVRGTTVIMQSASLRDGLPGLEVGSFIDDTGESGA